ncbi:MAG: hypothetical protein LBP22_04765 [Deltaproteobacteria bacterium]|jgi:hypothetical protein|nr:hypothetical protein [Deltaproteobacteria bacterium]
MELSVYRHKTIFILGAIAVFISCVSFWAAVAEATVIQGLAFVFVLAAEIAVTFLLSVLEASLLKVTAPVFRIGTYTAATIYFVLSFGTSLLFIAAEPAGAGILITLQLVFLGLLAAAVLIFMSAGQSQSRTDADTAERQSRVFLMSNKLSGLLDRFPRTPDRPKLAAICEDVRYFNANIELPGDEDLGNKIDELLKAVPAGGGETDADISGLLEQLRLLVLKRRQESSTAQRGSS